MSRISFLTSALSICDKELRSDLENLVGMLLNDKDAESDLNNSLDDVNSNKILKS